MNNYADEQWFGQKNIFNFENEEEHTWEVNENKIPFDEKRTWKAYVDSQRLEITCGEAPYLVSRYDATTGELILPPIRRIGMLDRKLRIVNACLVFFTVKLWQFYRERWCNLSLKVLIATLTTILVFGRTIREHIPINLLLLFLVSQIVYLGVLRYCDNFFANRNHSNKWDTIQKT